MARRVDVDAMLCNLTARQFLEWQAYARLEPFGELRDDYRAASIAQMIFNMAVVAKDRRPLGDFLLDWEAATEKVVARQTPEQHLAQQIAVAKIITMAYSVPGKDV